MGEAIAPAEACAPYSYPDDVWELGRDGAPVLELWVGDFPELREGREGFLESWLLMEARLEREASGCDNPAWPF